MNAKEMCMAIAEHRVKTNSTPTHLRIHPVTFKKIVGELWLGQHDFAGNTKEIKFLGFTVWLDKTIKEDEIYLLDMNEIMRIINLYFEEPFKTINTTIL